ASVAHICCLSQQGVTDTSADSGISLRLAQTNTHNMNVSSIRVHQVGIPDIVSLLAGRPLPKAVRNRSVPT
ncbi:MAG: hypothetical protein J07HX5_00131, partial [halophilic archaeon J07HX5]